MVASARCDAVKHVDEKSFNPLHCGAVVASTAHRAGGPVPPGRFQSPSLRGSGRFAKGLKPKPLNEVGFNPLHCGAVVASRTGAAGRRQALVSIPFIAGQWSLLDRPPRRTAGAGKVSIPFIAGQWSLQAGTEIAEARVDMFQSPSLRGSGRFQRADAYRPGVLLFQSPSLRGSGRFSS